MDFLQRYLGPVDESLNKLPVRREPVSLYEPCRYVLQSGGKRLRPILTLMANGLCGGLIRSSIPAAMSVELIHNFTLVHDDLMDHAEARRGQPTVHVKWDRPTAILTGDILYSEAFEQLLAYSDSRFIPGSSGSELFLNVQKELLNGTRIVCEGQALDMEFEQETNVSTEQYLKMIEGKTAALITTSLVLGGLVANGSAEQIKRLRELGFHLGIAFQIQDDLMDATANPEQFGKQQGGDIRERKRTFLLLQALEHGNELQRKELYRVMNLDPVENADVQNVITLFYETGAVQKATDRIEMEYRKAISLLNQFDDSTYKEDLEKLIAYLIHRES